MAKKYVFLILMFAVAVGACSESSPPPSKQEAAPSAEERLAQLQKQADSGNADTQFDLGGMYRYGKGVPEDTAKAVEWWQKAAAQGNADAQVNLGVMYYKGEGAPKDAVKALEWFQKSAAQGNATAHFYLGGMCYDGEGVPKDAAKAVEGWQKASALGHADAQHSLGFKYYLGDGVPKDSVLAYAWANLAAARGSKGASHLRDVIITLSSAQRAEAERLSSNWKLGQVLRREGESAAGDGNAASGGGTLAKKGTGTAFVVSMEGHAVTNHHVVASCKELRVQGRSESLQLITRDAVSDLALLKMPGETRAAAMLTPDPASLRQGQEIGLSVFPLDGVLSSGGNLTPGVVSATPGLRLPPEDNTLS